MGAVSSKSKHGGKASASVPPAYRSSSSPVTGRPRAESKQMIAARADSALDISKHIDRISFDGDNAQVSSVLSGKKKVKISVLGAGNYGTAMAVCAARNGHTVMLYTRSQERADIINATHRNPKYLSQYDLPENIIATSDFDKAMQGVMLIILAVPCQKVPEFIRAHRDAIPSDVLLCSTAKGLYLQTKQLIGDAITEAFNGVDSTAADDTGDADERKTESRVRRTQPLAFLSGPSFAEELVKGNPSAVVVASHALYHAVLVQKILSNFKTLRVYTSQDVIGVQLGGALKNPLAVGAGMISGLGFGMNTLSAMVTGACKELRMLCAAMGGKKETINGLSGIGDLMLTCFSDQSRNQRCGQRLIKGEKLEDILKTMTVEGVPTAQVAVIFADMCGLQLPIFRTVNDIIQGKITPEEAVPRLMGRPLGAERY